MELVVNQNDIHEAIWKWLFEGDNGISELSYISAEYDQAENIIASNRVIYTPITMGESTVVKEYIRSVKKMKYDFMIKKYVTLSTQSNSTNNLKVSGIFEDVIEWVKKQIKEDNYPKMPDKCTIQKMTVNEGTVAGVDKNGAEFLVIINIEYTKGV